MIAKEIGRAKKRRGLRRACSPPFRAGSLYPFIRLARGCRRIWRGEFWFIGFGGATLLDRIGPPGRCSGGWPHDRNSWLMPRVNPSHRPEERPGGKQCRARWSGDDCQRDRSRQKAPGAPACLLSAISGWFSLSLYPLGAWVPKNLARRILVYWFRRRDAARPDRAAWAVQRRLAARSQQLADAPR